MSHFYGTIKGTKGEATRCGHRTSGMRTVAASWSGCVETYLWYDEKTETDMVSVRIRPWRGNGVRLTLYEGPIIPQDPGDIDKALRCRTCVNYQNWSRTQLVQAGEPAAKD